VRTVDEERAPVERDVHDGAQQRLVILGGGLRHAEQGTASDDPRVESTGVVYDVDVVSVALR
jgi:signal transduction histidine kinase